MYVTDSDVGRPRFVFTISWHLLDKLTTSSWDDVTDNVVGLNVSVGDFVRRRFMSSSSDDTC